MTFKLSKTQMALLREMKDRLTDKKADLDAVIADAIPKIEAEIERLDGAHQTYVNAVVEAGGEISGWADDFETEWDDKSETWQDGERGGIAREWIEMLRQTAYEFENAEAPVIEFETEADASEDFAVLLDDLPEEAAY